MLVLLAPPHSILLSILLVFGCLLQYVKGTFIRKYES
jgi:hypothetical protein